MTTPYTLHPTPYTLHPTPYTLALDPSPLTSIINTQVTRDKVKDPTLTTIHQHELAHKRVFPRSKASAGTGGSGGEGLSEGGGEGFSGGRGHQTQRRNGEEFVDDLGTCSWVDWAGAMGKTATGLGLQEAGRQALKAPSQRSSFLFVDGAQVLPGGGRGAGEGPKHRGADVGIVCMGSMEKRGRINRAFRVGLMS